MKLILMLSCVALIASSCERKSPPTEAPEDAAAPAEADGSAEPTKGSFHTQHLDERGRPKFTNLLAKESSPYLRQHQHNPTNWSPWGKTAFDLARAQKKPILLSIGYSTCHWCHVMARESFDDLEIAKVLNERYIPVKVDREERPDIDALYMSAVVRLSGQGGWPATIWLTPDGEPFFAGTYFPPRKGARGAEKGFLELLNELADKHAADPSGIATQARALTATLIQEQQGDLGGPIGDRKRVLELALQTYERAYDPTYHGWGEQKFPMAARIRFLLRAAGYGTESDAMGMATRTLDAMARGALYDHVGGGFHRYTTDPAWQKPHFEKMLYDNAQLVAAYTEAWQATKSPLYARVVRGTVEFVLRELQAPGGGFYTALDAESGGEEGGFYLWTPAEIDAAAPEQAAALKMFYGVTERGNFEGGKTALREVMTLEDAAKRLDTDVETLQKTLDAGVAKLRAARDARPRPHRDEKIITAWNGLAIDAITRAAWVFGEESWLTAVRTATDALPAEKNTLRRSKIGDTLGGAAFADDYAFAIAALITVFEFTTTPAALRRAVLLQNQFDTFYWDQKGGGYFLTREAETGELPVRQKLIVDGALPSANSVAMMNALRLAALRDDAQMRDKASGIVKAFGAAIARDPAATPQALLAIDWMAGDPKEVAIVGPASVELVAVVRENFFPNHVIARPGPQSLVPWLAGKEPKDGKGTAYVCRNFACKLPTTEPQQFLDQMREP